MADRLHFQTLKLLGACIICLLTGILLFPNTTHAQALHMAVEYSLETSPALKAERLRLEALTEQRIQVLNLRRPTIQIEGSTSLAANAQKTGGYENWKRTEPGTLTLSLNQPLLLGGRFQASLREADLRIAQAIAQIRALELSTVRETIEAYGDVVRDDEILKIRLEGVSNLAEQLLGTQVRYAAGLVGLTELSQAQTRLAGAQGQVAIAKARLASSIASLERLIGRAPSVVPEAEFMLESEKKVSSGFAESPASLDDAIELALTLSHDVKVARFNEEIARATARVSQLEYAPRASLQAGVSGTSDDRFNGARSINTDVKASIVIPLWSGGQAQSRVRAALATANAARMDSLELEQKLRVRIVGAWENEAASRMNLVTTEEQVRASVIALTGTKLEQKIGVRSILEVLNQEQEVLEAKISLAAAKRDVVVNQAALLTLIGIDPTQVIANEPAIDASKLDGTIFDRDHGVPASWEKLGVLAFTILQDIDIDFTNALRSAKRIILGPEQ